MYCPWKGLMSNVADGLSQERLLQIEWFRWSADWMAVVCTLHTEQD